MFKLRSVDHLYRKRGIVATQGAERERGGERGGEVGGGESSKPTNKLVKALDSSSNVSLLLTICVLPLVDIAINDNSCGFRPKKNIKHMH